MIHALLANNLAKYMELTPTEIASICTYYKRQEVRKGEYILRQGQVCRFEGFVVEGCFTVSTADDRGQERILYFAAEDWWVMDIDSFTNHTGSELIVQAIEDSVLLTISKLSKERLYETLPKVERLFRRMAQKAVVAWQRRLVRNHIMTAEERYLHFLESYPDIALRITNRQIASYLGITHEFVSKIRSKQREKS